MLRHIFGFPFYYLQTSVAALVMHNQLTNGICIGKEMMFVSWFGKKKKVDLCEQ